MTTASPRGPVNFGLRGMLVIVAGLGAVFAAWRFFQENRDAERAVLRQYRDQLDDADPRVRVEAARGLGDARSDDARPVLRALVAALNDPEADVRESAAGSIHVIFGRPSERLQLDPDVPEASEALVRRLDDPAPKVRAAAARALTGLARPRPHPIPTGPGVVPNTDPGPLPEVGPDLARALPALEAIAQDADPFVREAALIALASLIADEAEARRRLITAFDTEPSPVVRLWIVGASGWTGPGARSDPEVARLLIRALDDPTPDVRSRAGWDLANARNLPDDARSALVAKLHAPRDAAGREAGDSIDHRPILLRSLLNNLGDDPEVLRPLLRDPNPVVRSMARGALGLPDVADDERP